MLKNLFLLFIKLGVIGFGGPAAHIAMMRQEIVARRKWMSEDEFLDMIGIVNLIPGPNSTELAIHIGKTQGGWKGLLISGLSFIIPAVVITFIFAVLYEQYGQLPSVQPFLYGIKPAIIAIIISAVWPLARVSFKSSLLLIIGILSFALALIGFKEIMIMAGAGIFMLAAYYLRHLRLNFTLSLAVLPLSKLFFIFLKIGAILYGSGYVLFAFLETDLVNNGLLTRAQLADAIAVGQMTPGPVFSSVTFIGYISNGWQGALVSTVAIFLPSFLFIALFSGLFNKLKSSPVFRTFLNGVIASSVSLIAAVAINLGKDSIYDWRTVVISVMALFISFAFRNINSAYVVLGSSISGYILSLF